MCNRSNITEKNISRFPVNILDTLLQYVCLLLLILITCGCFDFELCMQGDVYPVEPYESLSMNQVLDAHWGVLDDEDVSSNNSSFAKEASFVF